MFLNSLFVAAIAMASPLPDGDEAAESYLLPLYEGTEEDAFSLEEATERVLQLREQPLNINKVGVDELLSVPGIDAKTAESIVAHRHRYGQYRSVEELDMVRGMDDRLARYIAPLFYVEQPDTVPWYNVRRIGRELMHAKHSLILTAAMPTYYRAGDKGATTLVAQTTNRYADTYLGDPIKHSFRYSVTIGNNLQLNLSGAKAAGEPFFSAGNSMGYDRYAYNISVRDLGIVHYMVLGKYRGQFGMGLVFNNSLSFGKQSSLVSLGRRTTYFVPHSSTSDSHYMQGLATTLELYGGTLSLLFSTRYIDATLNDDGTISTVLTNATHRTAGDMAKKNNAAQTAVGAHYSYGKVSGKGVEWNVGVSYLYTAFSRPLAPVTPSKDGTISPSKQYRLYFPNGSNLWNGSIDYRLKTGPLTLTGETAVSENGAIATLANVMLPVVRKVMVTLVGRIYPYRYHASYGSALGDSRNVTNEKGILVGTRWAINKTLSLDAYTDVVRFPWLRYRVSAPSNALDNSLAMTYANRQWKISARYRYRRQQRDEKVTTEGKKTTTVLAEKSSHRLRVTAQYAHNPLSWRSNFEGILTADDAQGYIVSQAVTYTLSRRYSVYGTVSYFDTDDYDTRIYSYERGMLYNMNSASYYGNGFRCALYLRGDVTPWLLAQLKVGRTKYFDRSVIGTADRRIFSSSQTDIDLQVRVKF